MWALFLVAIFRWSAKRAKKNGRGEFPRQLQYNVPVELVLTIIPVVIVMALFFFTVQVQQKVVANDKDPEVAVDVTTSLQMVRIMTVKMKSAPLLLSSPSTIHKNWITQTQFTVAPWATTLT